MTVVEAVIFWKQVQRVKSQELKNGDKRAQGKGEGNSPNMQSAGLAEGRNAEEGRAVENKRSKSVKPSGSQGGIFNAVGGDKSGNKSDKHKRNHGPLSRRNASKVEPRRIFSNKVCDKKNSQGNQPDASKYGKEEKLRKSNRFIAMQAGKKGKDR